MHAEPEVARHVAAAEQERIGAVVRDRRCDRRADDVAVVAPALEDLGARRQVASAGAAFMAPTRARNSSGMASIRPGMARQNERSPIIGASTARMPASA